MKIIADVSAVNPSAILNSNKQLSLGAPLWNHLSGWLCKWSTIEMVNFEHGSVGGNRDKRISSSSLAGGM